MPASLLAPRCSYLVISDTEGYRGSRGSVKTVDDKCSERTHVDPSGPRDALVLFHPDALLTLAKYETGKNVKTLKLTKKTNNDGHSEHIHS